MAYTDDIPKPDDLISNSQGQLRANFNAIDSTAFGFARNHVALTDGTDGGLHKRVDYQAPVGDPGISGFVASLYTKASTNPTGNQLWYSNGTPVQVTGPVLKDTFGFMFLPGGLLVKWGWVNASGGANTITYPTGGTIPTFSAVYHVYMQPTAGGSGSNWAGYVTNTPGSFPTATFDLYSTQRTVQTPLGGAYSWLAIGAA